MFQSTRPQGARQNQKKLKSRENGFQSTRPQGARQPKQQQLIYYQLFQSTRPQGARLYHQLKMHLVKCFNPRARRGRDKIACGQCINCKLVSIHAPAGGATSLGEVKRSLLQGFNPRARRGRDISSGNEGGNQAMFQSTRPQGARQYGKGPRYYMCGVSIHAPAGGAT
jgi:hypothetical protein